jgi:hypothetical protein
MLQGSPASVTGRAAGVCLRITADYTVGARKWQRFFTRGAGADWRIFANRLLFHALESAWEAVGFGGHCRPGRVSVCRRWQGNIQGSVRVSHEEHHEEVDRLSPDPFDLPRRISKKLRDNQYTGPVHTVKYLWLYVSRDGLHVPGETSSTHPPTLEQWLALVDEAATLGVERMVVTALSDLSQLPDIWKICQWAQDGHDITVGIHVLSDSLPEETLAKMKELDLDKFRLFVEEEHYARYAPLEAEGIKVRVAKPAVEATGNTAGGEVPPHGVLFVNPAGQLYFAGSGGNGAPRHMGNIYEDLLAKAIEAPRPGAGDGGGIPSVAGFPLRD